MANIDIDPETIILRYRNELEQAQHNNRLLELAVQQLQAEVGEHIERIGNLERRVKELAKEPMKPDDAVE